MTIQNKKFFYIFFVLISIFIIYAYYYLSKSDIQTSNPNIITNFHKMNLKIGGDFTLTKHDGEQFKFSSLYGKPTLMYFGFTHCPDFCPTSLQIMDSVSNAIDVNRVFISVDPERDTVKALQDYVLLYKKGLIGLTGKLSETDKVAKQWLIYYSFNKQNPDDKNYVVDHTTYLYLVDKHGKLSAMFRPEATPTEITEFIKNNSN